MTEQKNTWPAKYFTSLLAFACVWLVLYIFAKDGAAWLSYDAFGLSRESRLGPAVEFFLYDTVKILLLLVAMIYSIAWARASLNTDKVRDYLAGKKRGLGYMLGSVFGAVTPFCSCSSIPLFLGFTTARIPIGITMAFLITSPIINEVAVVLLWSLLGWKFTVLYVTVGILAGVIGGFLMDSVNAGRWLQPFLLDAQKNAPQGQLLTMAARPRKLSVRDRHNFAYSETSTIFKRVWKWVFIGVGIGAGLHGFVPEDWFARNMGAGEWWSVPAAVFVAIPLYSNVTGIIPVMQSLLLKGLPIGTTLAFCMSSVAASLPEVIMLRQIMRFKLQALFIVYLWVIFTLTGWLFNFIGPYIM